MNKIEYPEKADWKKILQRPTATMLDLEDTVNKVFHDIKNSGNQAVINYTKLFDKVALNTIVVPTSEIEESSSKVTPQLKEAIKLAKFNIKKFHEAQATPAIKVETQQGVLCWQEKRPIQRVGLYIPGGSAPLFSTILMLAVPAKIAGCNEIVLCTPPNKDGKIHPAILYTAQLCGVSKIYKIGGIQAIGAMTFGTKTLPKVYKIFGPGNQYVTAAKQIATKHGVAIDMPAGPSELLIFADETANASFIASDLLSQAEHGEDSQVIFITTSKKILENVILEIKKQLSVLPRKEIAQKAMSHSNLILVKNNQIALELMNEYAPEHLIIVSEQEDFFVNNIENAGSVFIGSYTPESAGDYASGTNHTLPTNGYAKQYSGVNLDSFLKRITFQKMSEKGIQNIGPAIELMAEAEELQAHKNAITIRLQELNTK